MEENDFEGWVILELMGHRRIAGRCAEQKIAGAEVLRIDIEIRQLEHAPAGAHAAGSPYDDDVPV